MIFAEVSQLPWTGSEEVIHMALSCSDFQGLLARLDGSRWPVFEDQGTRQWIELAGGVLTYWIYYKTSEVVPTGTKDLLWSVPLEERSFVYKDPYEETRFELSKDGEVITSTSLWSKIPRDTGLVHKYRRENSCSACSRPGRH
jgi:hypothetical protein